MVNKICYLIIVIFYFEEFRVFFLYESGSDYALR